MHRHRQGWKKKYVWKDQGVNSFRISKKFRVVPDSYGGSFVEFNLVKSGEEASEDHTQQGSRVRPDRGPFFLSER